MRTLFSPRLTSVTDLPNNLGFTYTQTVEKLGDRHVLSHGKGKISESSSLTDQVYQTLMNFTRNSLVQALMRSFVTIEDEVALESSLQIRHCGAVT